MKRFFLDKLNAWQESKRRKPQVIRGLRQTGKTWCLKEFSRTVFPNGLRLIDFEQNPKWHKVFEPDLNPRRIVSELELLLGQPIEAGKTILVFDEIQQCPRALSSLRYFYEELPELHVAAAGSLLDFALEDISFPVGRVEFLDLFPMTFREYLIASGKETMAALLEQPPHLVSQVIHDALLQDLRQYWLTGGMPRCVQTWLDTQSVLAVRAEQENLLTAFRQDFSKYSPRVDRQCLEAVWDTAAGSVGRQIAYARLAPEFSGTTNKKAFQVLATARLLRPVCAVSAAGFPLRYTQTPHIKPLLGDIGFMQPLCGYIAPDEWGNPDLLGIYRGAIAEQYVGQELAALMPGGGLYWWKREGKNNTSEVDYLIGDDSGIQPIEVKSGSPGRLRSLHQLLADHPHCRDGIVFSCAPFSVLPEQRLRFIPIYYAGSPFLLGGAGFQTT